MDKNDMLNKMQGLLHVLWAYSSAHSVSKILEMLHYIAVTE